MYSRSSCAAIFSSSSAVRRADGARSALLVFADEPTRIAALHGTSNVMARMAVVLQGGGRKDPGRGTHPRKSVLGNLAF